MTSISGHICGKNQSSMSFEKINLKKVPIRSSFPKKTDHFVWIIDEHKFDSDNNNILEGIMKMKIRNLIIILNCNTKNYHKMVELQSHIQKYTFTMKRGCVYINCGKKYSIKKIIEKCAQALNQKFDLGYYSKYCDGYRRQWISVCDLTDKYYSYPDDKIEKTKCVDENEEIYDYQKNLEEIIAKRQLDNRESGSSPFFSFNQFTMFLLFFLALCIIFISDDNGKLDKKNKLEKTLNDTHNLLLDKYNNLTLEYEKLQKTCNKSIQLSNLLYDGYSGYCNKIREQL